MTERVARLASFVRKQIEADGPIAFDRFMEYALYHPVYGYYTATDAETRAGPHGDFITAPTLTPLFGRALARFVAYAWEAMGRPLSWWLVEVGAGTGALAAPMLKALKEDHGAAAHGLHVALVDRNPAHRNAAQAALADILPPGRVHVDDTPPSFAGRPVVVLANELLDNLPVRVLRFSKRAWRERCVDAAPDGGFVWVDAEAPSGLVSWAESFDVPPPDPQQVEVPTGAHDWLDEWTDAVGDAPTLMLLIDYGETARDLVGEPRSEGTLMAYAGHEQDRDVLTAPGSRDVTAHVNWTSIARHAKNRQWNTLGYTTQNAFLVSLGLMEAVAGMAGDVQDVGDFAALQAVKEVMLPGGMGERFKVLAITRGFTAGDAGDWPGLDASRPVDPAPRRR